MERRLNKKIETYVSAFKDNIKEKASQLNFSKTNGSINDLLQYIYDYDRLTLDKDDFAKRKRVKNMVPFFDRCCAKRANDEQCTRRKKEGSEYCGTHLKGIPHGKMEENSDTPLQQSNMQKVDVWAQEIKGIVYYIDKAGNVYHAEDIVSNKVNPSIIAKYERVGDVFSIPEFGI